MERFTDYGRVTERHHPRNNTEHRVIEDGIRSLDVLLPFLQETVKRMGWGVQKGHPGEQTHLWKCSRAGGPGPKPIGWVRTSEKMSSNTPHCWTIVLPTGDSLTPVKHSQKLGEPLETSCSGVGWSVKDRNQTNQRKKATMKEELLQQQDTKMKQMQTV